MSSVLSSLEDESAGTRVLISKLLLIWGISWQSRSVDSVSGSFILIPSFTLPLSCSTFRSVISVSLSLLEDDE